MAPRMFWVLVFICACSLMNVEAARKKTQAKDQAAEKFRTCALFKGCKCGVDKKTEIARCLDMLTEESKNVFIGNAVRLCNYSFDAPATFMEFLEAVCLVEPKVMEVCFTPVFDDWLRYVDEVHNDPEPAKVEESSSIEKSRYCIGPLFASCTQFPTMCL